MLICLPIETKSPNSLLAVQFEEAKYFLFVDSKTQEAEIIRNSARVNEAVYLAAGKRPKVVITGNILPNSFDFLKASGIKVYSGIFGLTAKQAVNNYRKKKLGESRIAGKIPKGKLL